MHIPQLLFGSSRNGTKGYQLLGATPGISDDVIRDFCRRAPSHDSLAADNDDNAEGLSFSACAKGRFLLTRTVFGGPEYSGRGRQIITTAMVLTQSQIDCYSGNPIRILDTALTTGNMILPAKASPNLPAIELPEKPLPASYSSNPRLGRAAKEAAQKIRSGNKVLFTEYQNPFAALDEIIISAASPFTPSFSSGLNPTIDRDVQLFLINELNVRTMLKLKRQNYLYLK